LYLLINERSFIKCDAKVETFLIIERKPECN